LRDVGGRIALVGGERRTVENPAMGGARQSVA
jgi:hypothetical protein